MSGVLILGPVDHPFVFCCKYNLIFVFVVFSEVCLKVVFWTLLRQATRGLASTDIPSLTATPIKSTTITTTITPPTTTISIPPEDRRREN